MALTKNQFIQLLHHFSDNSVEDAKGILSLKETYPYSQVLHALSARLAKDQGFATHQKELQLAAIYASDRHVLKEIMSRTTAAWPTSHEVDGLSHPEAPETISNPPFAKAPFAQTPVEEDVADELLHDLEKLSELRHNFEMRFIDTENTEIKHIEKVATVTVKAPIEEEEEEEEEIPTQTEKPKPQPPGRKPGRSKAQRIIELAKELEEKEQEEREEELDESTDELIKEIKTTKKKIVPGSEKQKEQIQIIDSFIRAQPSISNAKEKLPTVQVDIETVKSGDFNDNVISETLVDLLIRQGKKEKALEVLKKLIWKFPQKKAYFAAQIEELKQ